MELYQHKTSKDTAVEVLKFFRPPGKDYAIIKVRWWRTHPRGVYCMGFITKLQVAEGYGEKSLKDRRKYPISRWRSEWELLDLTNLEVK